MIGTLFRTMYITLGFLIIIIATFAFVYVVLWIVIATVVILLFVAVYKIQQAKQELS